ncbi:MAG: aminotransferase class IV [Candidatus Omnitrophota bacterium]
MQIEITDKGFLYGQGVFETMRVYNRKIFCFSKHLERLIRGTRAIGLDKISKKMLEKSIEKIIAKQKKNNFRIKLISWHSDSTTKHAVIISKLKLYPECFTAMVSKIRQNENSPLANIKSLNYLNFLLARNIAQKNKFDEAILLNSKGYLAEGSCSNIFFVRNNLLFTPSLDSGCLEGITRKVVLEIAKKYKIKVKEGSYRKQMLLTANEAFLTNAIIGIMPLIKVGNQKINYGLPGKLTRYFQEKYKLEIYKKCYN